MDKLCFLRRGRTEADLNESGKMPSESARLIMLVMGSKRESRHDLIRKVGMMSRAQEALEDLRIAALTLAMLAGEKAERRGRTNGGSICGETL